LIKLEEYSKIPDVSEACWQIGISPDGEYLALTFHNEPHTVQLCDLKGEIFKKLEGHRGMVHSIAFASDGRTLISGSADKTVRIWSPTGDLLGLFDRFDQSVESVSYAPEVPILAGGQADGNIIIFDIACNYIATLQSPKKRIYCLSWSGDNNFLAAACGDKNLYLYNIAMQTKRVFEHPGAVYGVSFAKSNGTMATSCEDGAVRFIKYNDDKVEIIDSGDKRTVGITYSPDDKVVVAASFDKSVKFFDNKGQPIGKHKLDSEALGVTFSANGERIYISTKDRYLHIYNVDYRE